jgi:hypothetical protein
VVVAQADDGAEIRRDVEDILRWKAWVSTPMREVFWKREAGP